MRKSKFTEEQIIGFLKQAQAGMAVAEIGRRLKCLTVADDFSHEAVDIAVDYGISGQYVTRLLDQAALFRGYPSAVRTDKDPELPSRH